jgi:hypothetical protein
LSFSRQTVQELQNLPKITLRTSMRLAMGVGLLDHSQGLFALECADRIGRQLGGWRRALAAP